jgi:hypothetical protein
MLLQLLVGKIDTKLLKAVLLEALKSIDIQDAHEYLRVWILAD